MDRRLLATVILIALIVIFSAIITNRHRTATQEERPVEYVDCNLEPLKTLEGAIEIGTLPDGRIVADRPENTEKVTFLDRLGYYLGEKREVKPLDWWFEVKGAKVKPTGRRACIGSKVVARTGLEIVESDLPVITLFSEGYAGKRVRAGNGCIWVEKWEDLNVPVLLEGEGVVDPQAEKVCMDSGGETNTIIVTDENGRLLSGFYSLGTWGRYNAFFGKFDGSIEVTGCVPVRIYSDGHRPLTVNPCKERNVSMERLKRPVRVKGGLLIDIFGALAGMGEANLFPAYYRKFELFPLREENRSLPSLPIRGWLGYKLVSTVPPYTWVLTERGYIYTTPEGAVPLDKIDVICTGDKRCLEVGSDRNLLCWQKDPVVWNGVEVVGKECLGVKTLKGQD